MPQMVILFLEKKNYIPQLLHQLTWAEKKTVCKSWSHKQIMWFPSGGLHIYVSALDSELVELYIRAALHHMADCQKAVSQVIRKMAVYYGARIKRFTCGMTSPHACGNAVKLQNVWKKTSAVGGKIPKASLWRFSPTWNNYIWNIPIHVCTSVCLSGCPPEGHPHHLGQHQTHHFRQHPEITHSSHFGRSLWATRISSLWATRQTSFLSPLLDSAI